MKTTKLLLIALFFACNTYATDGVSFFKAGFPDVAKPVLLSEFPVSANKAETCYYLGNCYYLEGKADSAAYYFTEGLKVNPLNQTNNVGLLMLKMKSQSAKITDDIIDEILSIKKNRKDIQLILSIASAYLYNGNTEKATEFQQAAQELQPENPSVFVLAGDIQALSDRGKAAVNYEFAMNYDPKCIEAYIKYARVYKNVNPTLALEKLQLLEAKYPDFMLTEREFGDVYYAKNDFASAVKHYETYLNSGNKTTTSDLVKYAMALFMNHDFQKSIDIANKGLVNNPGNPAFNRLVMYNYIDLKKYDEGSKAASSFFNDSKGVVYNYLDFRYYGLLLKETKKYSQAIEQFKKAYSTDSTKVENLKDISDLYTEMSDYDNAISYYTKYASVSPKGDNKTELKMAIGKLLYKCGTDTIVTSDVRAKSLNRADSVFNEMVQLKPEDYRGNFWRARVNAALDPETTKGLAKPYYDLTVSFVEPKKDLRYKSILIECYSYLGWYMLVQKDNATSLDYWKKILALDPTNAVALKGIQHVLNTK